MLSIHFLSTVISIKVSSQVHDSPVFVLAKILIPHTAFYSHLTLANLGIDSGSFKVHLQWQLLEGLWRVWEHTAGRGRLQTLIQLTGFTLPSPSVTVILYDVTARGRCHMWYFSCRLGLLAGWSWHAFFPSQQWHWLLLLSWSHFTLFPLPLKVQTIIELSVIPPFITDCLSSLWPSKKLLNVGSLACGAFTLGNCKPFTAFKLNLLVQLFLCMHSLLFSNHVYPAASAKL